MTRADWQSAFVTVVVNLRAQAKRGSSQRRVAPSGAKMPATLAVATVALVHDLDGCFSDSPTGSCDQAGELTFVDMDTFLAPSNHHFLPVQSTLCLRNRNSYPSHKLFG